MSASADDLMSSSRVRLFASSFFASFQIPFIFDCSWSARLRMSSCTARALWAAVNASRAFLRKSVISARFLSYTAWAAFLASRCSLVRNAMSAVWRPATSVISLVMRSALASSISSIVPTFEP